MKIKSEILIHGRSPNGNQHASLTFVCRKVVIVVSISKVDLITASISSKIKIPIPNCVQLMSLPHIYCSFYIESALTFKFVFMYFS